MQQVNVRHRVFLATFVAFAVFGICVAWVTSVIGPGPAAPRIRATADWPSILRASALFLVPALLLARCASGWIASQFEAPLNACIERARAIRKHRAPWSFAGVESSESVAPLARGLDTLVEHLRRVLHHQHQCLTDAAHELRTPLTAQTVVAESALTRPESETDLREAIVSVLEESRYMQRLIEHVLLLKRASAAPVDATTDERSTRQVHDLSALAQGCVQTLQVLAEEKGQVLTVDLCGTLWSHVEPTIVRQAILNVVHNAIEHCPPATRIQVSTVRESAGRGIVVVTDDGQGIADEDRQRVFSSFFRGARTSRHRGLGLGLAIAKATLISQGANIRLLSTPGAGCRFDLDFPLTARAEDYLQPRPRRMSRVRARAVRDASLVVPWPETILGEIGTTGR
jgi:two-component system, OmpR family, heavy metal sensor histidine kinase CusS